MIRDSSGSCKLEVGMSEQTQEPIRCVMRGINVDARPGVRGLYPVLAGVSK